MAVKPQPKQDASKPREEGAEPLMDGMNNAMRKMLAKAKEKGFITSEELNAVLPSEQVSTDQIEDIMAQLNEMGINVVDADEETEEAEDSVEEETRTVGNLDDEEVGRTDDPVRMYLREMGSVELLSREGEIAIAKRIEAGRDTMIWGLCERHQGRFPLPCAARGAPCKAGPAPGAHSPRSTGIRRRHSSVKADVAGLRWPP